MADKDDKDLVPEDDKPLDEYAKRVSVPGAIASGLFNAAFIGLITIIPTLHWPFITPAFAAVMIPIMAGPAASVVSSFLRLGYVTPVVRRLSGIVVNAAGAWGSWALWSMYPFALTAIGLPAFADTALRWGFLFAGVFSIIGVLKHLFGLLRGNKGPLTKRDAKRLERMDRIAMRRKKDQDTFFGG